MKIFCIPCDKNVKVKASTGKEIYPHIKKIWEKVFFQCPICNNYVGSHDDGRPLGTIPSPELRQMRMNVHKIADPIWKSGKINRSKLYKEIARRLDQKHYHTAEIKSVEEAEKVLSVLEEIKQHIDFI